MKEEYKIPGMPDVGTPGNRRNIQTEALENMFREFNNGEGMLITREGMPIAKSTLPGNPSDFAELRNIRTSMADADIASNPYHAPNPRRDTLMPPLRGKCMTIVGLGGGANIPIELLKCGVDHFHLIDHDILEPANAIRHPCSKRYFGLPKVEAVKLHMLDLTSQEVEITAHNYNVFDDRKKTIDIIEQSDVLIVATDTEASRHFLNEIAVKAGVPAVFVGMFENGSGGEIFAALPDAPCYCCLAEHLGREKFLTEYRETTKKADCSSARDTSAMPALGIDQGLLALIAARKSVDILLSGVQHSLPPLGGNWIIFSIFGIPKILETSLSSIQSDLTRHPKCFACGEPTLT